MFIIHFAELFYIYFMFGTNVLYNVNLSMKYTFFFKTKSLNNIPRNVQENIYRDFFFFDKIPRNVYLSRISIDKFNKGKILESSG